MNYIELKNHLSLDEYVYITGHVHPDGDCVGSALALYHLLKKDGYNVRVILEEKPNGYEFLNGYEEIYTLSDYTKYQGQIMSSSYQLIIVDSGDLSRIEPFMDLFSQARLTINIDHHSSNDHFADIQQVDVQASSTCEVIGMMLGLHKHEHIDDVHIATALYTGIIYDTGLFKHDCTRKETHYIAAKLVDVGVDQTFLINKLYFTKTEKSLKALQIALSNMKVFGKGHIVMAYISYEDMEKHNLQKSDTEAIVNQLVEVDTAYISCFILGIDHEKYKISLRSKSLIDVCEIAQKYKGGGHIKAAGCSVDGKLTEVIKSFESELVNAYERNS